VAWHKANHPANGAVCHQDTLEARLRVLALSYAATIPVRLDDEQTVGRVGFCVIVVANSSAFTGDTTMFVATMALAAAMAAPLVYPPAGSDSLAHWPADQRDTFRTYETALLAVPSADRLRAWHDLLACEPHVAGTPGDLRNVDRLADAFASMELKVEKHEIWVYLARPIAAEIEIVSPEKITLPVREDVLDEDPASNHPDLDPGWNAYSGSGDVTAQVVYANYGRKADFEKLAELGVSCQGKIVIARYGGNFRGYKAKFAQAAGAAGLIIYTEPANGGGTTGIPYPEGGYPNSTYIQRGSILTLPYPGDPLTPGTESTKNAARLNPDDLPLPAIPVQPIGYGAATKIMGRMRGERAPAGWQGGMPVAYRVTGGPDLQVRIHIEQERKVTKTYNVIGTLRGTTNPEQKVVIGCHHDAWGFGAGDPLSGMISLLECARAFSEIAQQGQAPARSLVFAGWGAEEFGIIGSTEWVEANRQDLFENAVGYINLDAASMGPNFRSSASPSIRATIAEAIHTVPQARNEDGQSVFDVWTAKGTDPLVPGSPRFGDMGGGSDHIGFLCHTGVASLSLGAGGSNGSSYHSVYDALPWYRQVVGEDYEPALMVGRTATAVAARLVQAPLLPLDPGRYGPETIRHLESLTKRGQNTGFFSASANGISPQLARIEDAAVRFKRNTDAVFAGVFEAMNADSLNREQIQRINAMLLAADRAWIVDRGIPDRPWFKNLFVATDENSAYAMWMLPALRYAIEHKDAAVLKEAEYEYVAVFDHLNSLIDQIDALLVD